MNRVEFSMNESAIKASIEQRIKSSDTIYSGWTIDITDDPERRKREHDNPTFWSHWKADSETIARNVEKYFLAKGMKGDTGGGKSPNYVYVF